MCWEGVGTDSTYTNIQMSKLHSVLVFYWVTNYHKFSSPQQRVFIIVHRPILGRNVGTA